MLEHVHYAVKPEPRKNEEPPAYELSACWIEGTTTYVISDVTCRDCLAIIKDRRRERLRREAADREIKRILKKRAAKVAARLADKQQRRTNPR
jgi:hypothetical protein